MKKSNQEIILLEYSINENSFRFNTKPEIEPSNEWIVLGQIDLDTAILFVEHIQEKYKEKFPDAETMKKLYCSFLRLIAANYKHFLVKYLGLYIAQHYRNKKQKN